MTLREMIRRYPDRFYFQTWYEGEAFLEAQPRPWLGWPDQVLENADGVAELATYTAADLAGMYLEHPDRPIWLRYLWTSDTDAQGQRVYVGANSGLFEIHRHLALSDRWGVPV
jgi:hypothetical protein